MSRSATQGTLFNEPRAAKSKRGVPRRELSIKQRQDAADKQNLECARIILADVEKYGGEGSLMVRCSRMCVERIEGAESAKQESGSGLL